MAIQAARAAGYPGSAGGRTVAELFEEVEALKHFMRATTRRPTSGSTTCTRSLTFRSR
jgi:hypothetical protein